MRADSALYDHGLIVFLDQRKVGFAISVPVLEGLGRRRAALEDADWSFEREDAGAMRHWGELDYLPDGAIEQKEGAVRRLRYLPIRITKQQGALFADGTEVKHFCVVTNRDDPEGGDAGDLLGWHRGKASTIEHSHHVLTNELAAEALPSQAFGANAASFRMNVICYNLISAFKRLGLPEAYHKIRPQRLRFLVLNTLGRVVRHAREQLLRCASAFSRQALDWFRVRIHAALPPRAATLRSKRDSKGEPGGDSGLGLCPQTDKSDRSRAPPINLPHESYLAASKTIASPQFDAKISLRGSLAGE